MTAPRLILPFDTDTRWKDLGLDLRVAACSDVPLLITGNREAARLVARTIHDRSPGRRSAPFTIGQHETLFETLASISMQFAFSMGERYLVHPGSYQVVAEKQGYRRLELTVEVGSERNQHYEFSMQRLPGRLA